MLYTRVFEIYDNALGENHLWAAAALNNRADLLRRQVRIRGRFLLEVRWCSFQGVRHIFSIKCKQFVTSVRPVLGPTTPRTLFTLQGEYAGAGALQTRVLDILGGTIGTKSSSYASTLSNRATVLLAEVRLNGGVLSAEDWLDLARFASACRAASWKRCCCGARQEGFGGSVWRRSRRHACSSHCFSDVDVPHGQGLET